MIRRCGRLWAATLLTAIAVAAPARAENDKKDLQGPAVRLAQAQEDPALHAVVADILEGNPELAAAAARARAAALEAPQVRALPDPMAGVTLFLAGPETRVGPQRLMLAVSQRLPWLSKLALAERVALLEAAALEAEVEAQRLRLVTEGRKLWYELAFLERQRHITEEFRAHLEQHEEIARTRYATGIGQGQGVIKLQAEITRAERELLAIRERQAVLAARIGALRDGVWHGLASRATLPAVDAVHLELESLRERAYERRPELAAAAARVSRAEAMEQLAEKRFRPDFSLGLTYTLVEERQDEAGRLQPPPGNGDDVFGLQGGITLPVRREKLRAGLEQADELRLAALEGRRAARTRIDAELNELLDRLPLAWRQLRLLEDVLIVQAEESLASARAGYVAGALGALDLLDAEHVLFDARTAVARAAADYAIYLARLEGVVGEPLKERDS
jgi:outer membrane protein TolC